jgi:hypothetical protein
MAGHRVALRKQPIWGLAEARVTGTVTCALGDIRIRSLGLGPVAALIIVVKIADAIPRRHITLRIGTSCAQENVIAFVFFDATV